MIEGLDISQRRACSYAGLSRTSYRQAPTMDAATQALGARRRFLRQVADESEVLAIQAAGRQRQQQRGRSDQGHDFEAQLMGRPHHGGARIGHRRHPRFAEQTDVMSFERRMISRTQA